jgi:hypothetical protein
MDLTRRLVPNPRPDFKRFPAGRACGLLTFAQYVRCVRVPHTREGSSVSGCTLEPLPGRTSPPAPITAGRKSLYHRAIST